MSEIPVDMSRVLSMVVDGGCTNLRATSRHVMYTLFGLMKEITIISEKPVDL